MLRTNVLRRPRLRSDRGNMLALVAVVLLGAVMLLIGFGLNYVRFLGTHQEQTTAIEAAALAAASDISRLVINTNEFGYVSLSDAAQNNSGTNAADGFPLPVHGINTLIATARLEYIIGNYLNSKYSAGNASSSGVGVCMMTLASVDLNNAKTVAGELNNAVTDALSQNPSGKYKDSSGGTHNYTDVQGKSVAPSPYKSIADHAAGAYQENCIRMTGSSNYVNGTMSLTAGGLTSGIATNIAVPSPQSSTYNSDVLSTEQYSGYYLSDMDIQGNEISWTNYDPRSAAKTLHWIFGAVSASPRLVDPSKFASSANSPSTYNLDYQIYAVVKADADQTIRTSQDPNGGTVHASACAAATSVYDPLPAPGSFSISFPDGQPPEISTPASLFTNSQMTKSSGGDHIAFPSDDYPTNPAATFSDSDSGANPPRWTGINSTATKCDMAAYAFSDWIRRAGTKAKIDAVANMLAQTLPLPPGSGPGWGNAPAITTINPYGAVKAWYSKLNVAGIGSFALAAPPLAGEPTNLGGWDPLSIGIPIVNVPALAGIPAIPAGIMHIYKWNTDGSINYQNAYCVPYPYEVSSQDQMYGESISNVAFADGTSKEQRGHGPGIGDVQGIAPAITSVDGFSSNTPDIAFNNVVLSALGLSTSGNGLGYFDLLPVYDVFVRDECRQGGQNWGGKHGGEPLSSGYIGNEPSGSTNFSLLPFAHGTLLASDRISRGSGAWGRGNGNGQGGNGGGQVPIFGNESDFNDAQNIPPAPLVQFPSNGGSVRPTYTTNGSAIDIRFRRSIHLSQTVLSTLTTAAGTTSTLESGSNFGYLGLVQ